MPPRIRRSLLGIALVSLTLAGCQWLTKRPPYAQDPLLISKKPLEGRFDGNEPVRIAHAEPLPPPLPVEAFAWVPPGCRVLPSPSSLVAASESPRLKTFAQTTEDAQPPSVAKSDNPGKTAAVVKAIPVARLKTPEAYGYAPDHSWLQGVLEQADSGQLILRYGDSSVEDPLGGRVNLETDARLVQLRPGDVIRVEGEIISREKALPQYRVREVWLVKRQT
jgi:hypothetical protein